MTKEEHAAAAAAKKEKAQADKKAKVEAAAAKKAEAEAAKKAKAEAAADKNPLPPCREAYKTIVPLGAKFGDSSVGPEVSTFIARLAISITPIR